MEVFSHDCPLSRDECRISHSGWTRKGNEDECGSQTKVLVVESRVGGHPIWLYVTCPDSAFEDEAEMQRLAILAAQAYRDRWQIERSFETVKQEFSLEKLRVRTFRRLKNVFSLCVVAYLFVTRYLRASSRFRGLVKIRDKLSLKIRDKRGKNSPLRGFVLL